MCQTYKGAGGEVYLCHLWATICQVVLVVVLHCFCRGAVCKTQNVGVWMLK